MASVRTDSATTPAVTTTQQTDASPQTPVRTGPQTPALQTGGTTATTLVRDADVVESQRQQRPAGAAAPPPTSLDQGINPGNQTTTTEAAAAAQEAGEQESPAGKIFKTLSGFWRNPIFQGLLAVLCVLPGVGQIASGIGVVLALTDVIGNLIADPKKPFDWMGLGQALLFAGGVFVPGLGAFGGLLGMLRSAPRPSEAQGATQPQDTTKPEGGISTPEELQHRYESVTAEAEQALATGQGFSDWHDDVLRLQREQRLLNDRRATQGDAQDQQEVARLAQLDELFGNTLPQLAAAHGVRVAFGLDDPTPTELPTAGRMYQVGESDTLESIAGAATGFDPQPSELGDAIRSFNGTDPVTPGALVYIPGPEQMRMRPAAGWGERMPLAEGNGDDRNRILAIYGLLKNVDTPAARQVSGVHRALTGMPVRATPMEGGGTLDTELEPELRAQGDQAIP